jgi:Lysozyme like domain
VASGERVNGTALAAIFAGAAFVWAGIKGYSVPQAIQNIVTGKTPATGQAEATLTGETGSATPSGVPEPTGALSYNQAALVTLWQQAGGSAATARNAACHAMQESGGNSKVTSSNPDGGINVGLWQLDTKGVGAGHSIAELQNPMLNAQLTVQATSNGQDWSEWSTPGC